MFTLRSIRIIQRLTIAVVMCAAIQLAIFLGVEEKSWIQRSWEVFTGGGIGLIAGAAFFVLVGAVGWVSGPVFGAIGVLGLATGGALGGMGLGALFNIIRDPDRYNVSYPIVLVVVVLSAFFSTWLSTVVANRLTRRMRAQ